MIQTKLFIIAYLIVLLASCNMYKRKNEDTVSVHYIRDLNPFKSDSTINVVIEIPAGTNQKWEVNKQTGNIEWEQNSTGIKRIIQYLPYPANYGFVPQTQLLLEKGGDNDPIDIFVLGETIPRGTVCEVKIIGIIYMFDNQQEDSKLLAVLNNNNIFYKVNTIENLEENYPGVIDILKIWLTNYKGYNNIRIDSVGSKTHAISILKNSHIDYLLNNK
jgi:inorganic pyrophosphatase